MQLRKDMQHAPTFFACNIQAVVVEHDYTSPKHCNAEAETHARCSQCTGHRRASSVHPMPLTDAFALVRLLCC
jgi:hypothetical protein